MSELDLENGAFPWWSGHSDWKTLTLLADYLLQSLQGAEDALLSASLSAQIHRQSMYAEEHSLRTVWRAAAQSKRQNAQSLMAVLPQDAQARRRRMTITSSAENCFFHLGQSLDRLAAAAMIVGGFEIPGEITGIYWSTLEQYAEMLKAGNQRSTVLQPVETAGRAIQEALVKPVHEWQQFGPTDWFPWMRATRNAMSHRAVGTKLNVTAGTRLTRLFYRAPKWSELQSLVFGGRPPKKPFFDAFIPVGSQEILEGLCDSTTKMIEAVVQEMVTCWDARRANPEAIVQHGAQWPTVEPSQSAPAFPGYGPPLSISGKQLVLHPLDARRWEAARASDDRVADWYR